jgi:ABC-type transport system involved in cytochrome c biogenesis permease subunit
MAEAALVMVMVMAVVSMVVMMPVPTPFAVAAVFAAPLLVRAVFALIAVMPGVRRPAGSIGRWARRSCLRPCARRQSARRQGQNQLMQSV